jgi:hypothetical protein
MFGQQMDIELDRTIFQMALESPVFSEYEDTTRMAFLTKHDMWWQLGGPP